MRHTLRDTALYIYRFMNRYTVLLYKTCTDEMYFYVHNSYKQDTHVDIADGLYFCVHNCTLLYKLTCLCTLALSSS